MWKPNPTKRYHYSARRSPPDRHPKQKSSFGVVIVNAQNQVLLVQRKDSFGYLACVDNSRLGHENIAETLGTITIHERDKLLSCGWDELWKNCGMVNRSDAYKKQCHARFEWLGIRGTVAVMDKRGEQWQTENSWGLPKGRMAKIDNETALRCALREMQEETGLNANQIKVNHSAGTLIDSYKGTDGRIYRSVYYVANIQGGLEHLAAAPDTKEVRQVKWASPEECRAKLELRDGVCDIIEAAISKLKPKQGSRSPPIPRRRREGSSIDIA